ncbi:MAG TPA: ATP-dependent DNA helicase [Methylibium sp.]|uniref:ATP-dependent DNA helicase n=1 Tax=Methylibium sp. TaxID=2067992 RepID=UPI002DBE1AF2|nr:ATP-dependent DNA helicase [Methylibium sp.]HEU4460239.1 ATP-dependent DNA helicase [Methylibium sp.]
MSGAPARSALQAAVDEAFAFGGPLHAADPGYRPREAQTRMAEAVVGAIERADVLAVEAGTGVGKTFAYLVPALLSGRRTLVSTATKSLQDQLFLRDLPRLRASLALPLTAALLKGRASYLCLHRLKHARSSALAGDRFALRTIARIETWAPGTATGDLAELDGLDERSSAIPLVTSTRENCLGSDCPEYRACHVLKARREAMAADLVVVNHHLFFADLRLRETGIAELLPSVELVIFDEAHQLTDAGIGFLGETLASAQVADLARDVLHLGLTQARGLQPWAERVSACETALRELRLAAGEASAAGQRSRWADLAGRPEFSGALQRLGTACEALAQALDQVAGASPDLDKLGERSRTLAKRAAHFGAAGASDRVRWIDRSSYGLRLVESPLDVRDAMREQIASGSRAWVFTSATLGSEAKLRWFTAQAGLDEATTVQIGSPFDYASHARLHVPARFPKPNEPAHADAVAELAAACARAAGGRSFVLTTSLRAMTRIGERLQDALADEAPPIEVLLQGSAPKRQLLQRFVDRPRAVLVGSQSFWEGIDVAGDALQCVLIDKLPFPAPNDPLVEARVRRIEEDGGDPFGEHYVAEAAISIKQGAGRLIRSETDRGLLVIADPRLRSMGYGRRILAALPPMPRLDDRDDALAWLREIASS